MSVTWGTRSDFTMMIWAGCEKVSVGFGDDQARLASGFAELAANNAELSFERAQFKLSIVSVAAGEGG